MGEGTIQAGGSDTAGALLDRPPEHALGRRVAGVSARRRRRALVLVPLVIAALVASVVYLQGGARLTGSGGSIGGPVDIGAEFHTTVFLDTDGGTIELVSARPIGATPDLRVELTLVRPTDGAVGVGSNRGPLDDRFRPVELRGHRLRTSDPDDLNHLIDVRLVATSEGIHQLAGIEVTYRSGFLRERTAVLPVPVCLSATDDWMADWEANPEFECPLPEP
ncbi:MAG: hypothetical protein ACO1PW_13420 [Actinomycetota bacterium]